MNPLPVWLAGLRAVFSDDWVFAAAWTHYLVFDMVVGAWIARDSVKLELPRLLRTGALVLTFLAGPVGFLTHILGRGVRCSLMPGRGLGRGEGVACRLPPAPEWLVDAKREE
jgi:hypothetical protein